MKYLNLLKTVWSQWFKYKGESSRKEFLEYYGGLTEWDNQHPKLVLRREQYYHFSISLSMQVIGDLNFCSNSMKKHLFNNNE